MKGSGAISESGKAVKLSSGRERQAGRQTGGGGQVGRQTGRQTERLGWQGCARASKRVEANLELGYTDAVLRKGQNGHGQWMGQRKGTKWNMVRRRRKGRRRSMEGRMGVWES